MKHFFKVIKSHKPTLIIFVTDSVNLSLQHMAHRDLNDSINLYTSCFMRKRDFLPDVKVVWCEGCAVSATCDGSPLWLSRDNQRLHSVKVAQSPQSAMGYPETTNGCAV